MRREEQTAQRETQPVSLVWTVRLVRILQIAFHSAEVHSIRFPELSQWGDPEKKLQGIVGSMQIACNGIWMIHHPARIRQLMAFIPVPVWSSKGLR